MCPSKHIMIFLCAVVFLNSQVTAEEARLIVVDFKTATLTFYEHDAIVNTFPVVLPRGTVLSQMDLSYDIVGNVVQIDYKPTWWPTKNMRARNSALPVAVSYGEPGHPIGLYRFRIHWINPANKVLWSAIRIHGGAKDKDLRGKHSSGCIRMKDEDITALVRLIGITPQGVPVQIHP